MPEFQVPGLLVKSSVVWIISEPHVGKTLLMLDMALALATQQEFLGITPTKRQRTMAFFLDSPAWAMRSQLESLVSGRQLRVEDLDEWFYYRTRPTGGRASCRERVGRGMVGR